MSWLLMAMMTPAERDTYVEAVLIDFPQANQREPRSLMPAALGRLVGAVRPASS